MTRCCACWRKKDVATHTSVSVAVAAWQGYGSTTTNLDSEHCFSHTSVRILRINDTSRKPRHSDSFTNETGANMITALSHNAAMFNSTGSQVMIFLSN